MKSQTLRLLLALSALATLNACVPAIVAGAATAVVVVHDRRTPGAFIDDAVIEGNVGRAVSGLEDRGGLEVAHINVESFNGIVLLTGEAVDDGLRNEIIARARRVQNIRRIINEIRIAPPASLGTRSQDGWISAKVKTTLTATRGVDSTRIKVVTDDSIVYLMGMVTREEGDLAAAAAAKVPSVRQVVKLFELMEHRGAQPSPPGYP